VGPQIGQGFDDPIARGVPGDPEPEGAQDHGRVGQYSVDFGGKAGGRQRVGVEEEKDVARGCCRAGVHLPATAWGACHYRGASLAGNGRCPVAAAAIGHDDLMHRFRGKRRQCGRQRRFLIAGRDDDRDA